MKKDDSWATILLVSRLRDLCDKDGEEVQQLKPKEYWDLYNKLEGKLRELFGQSAEELSSNYDLRLDLPTRIALLLGDDDKEMADCHTRKIDDEIEKLQSRDIKTLTPFDDCYPERFRTQLEDKAPPLLYVAGDLDLLQRRGVGIVGSRDINDDGAEKAKDAAELAARLGYVLISGGARGVDQIAMNAAFEAGGAVVGILADSLLRKLKTPDLRRAIHDGRAVMCTPYNPDAPFSVGAAMGRNKLVYALSLITLVIASEHNKGGTWAGAVEALNDKYGQVGVWRGKGEGSGNQELIIKGKGAEAISSIDDLETVLQQMATSSGPDTEAISSTDDPETALKDPQTTSPEPKAAPAEPTPSAQPSLF